MPNIDIGVIRQRIGQAQQAVTQARIGITERISNPPQVISRLPDVLTAATRANIVSLTRQQEASKLPVPESLEEVSNRLREAETSQQIATELSNFKPVITESVVQRRRGVNPRVEGGDDGKNIGKSQARKQIFSPTNSINIEIANRLKNLIQLGLQKSTLLSQTTALEQQIAATAAKLKQLTDAGASIERIREYEAQLERFSILYDQTKNTLEKIKKLYDGEYKILEKLRKKRDELQKNFWKNYDKIMSILKKFREIPKKIKFPKLPKLPTLNIRKSNIKAKILDTINKIKQSSQKASKVSVTKAKEEAQEKIRDPQKGDRFQKAASKARQALQNARQNVERVQATKNAIIDATTGQLDNELKRIRAGVDSAQKQLEANIDKASARSSAQLMKLQQAQQRAQQLRDTINSTSANLIQQAVTGITSAQNFLNKELVSADLQSSQNLINRSIDELQKVNELKNNITEFLNSNSIKKFTVGVGISSTLRSARQQSLSLSDFKQKYPEVFNKGTYDTTSRIGNVDGVYIVVTTYYERPTNLSSINR